MNGENSKIKEKAVNAQENQESASKTKAESYGERRFVMPRRPEAVLD